MSWVNFIHLPYREHYYEDEHKIPSRLVQRPLITCSNEIVEKLAQPRLTEAQVKWCLWALSPTGGKVVVGKS